MSEQASFTIVMSETSHASVVIEGDQAAVSMIVDTEWLAQNGIGWQTAMGLLAAKIVAAAGAPGDTKPKLRVVK